MQVALDAAAVAESEGRGVRVVDVRTLTPCDDDTIFAAVRATGRAIVVAEAAGFASVASELVARIQENCFSHLEAPVLRVTGFDVPFAPPKLEKYYLPDVDRVLDAIDRLGWES